MNGDNFLLSHHENTFHDVKLGCSAACGKTGNRNARFFPVTTKHNKGYLRLIYTRWALYQAGMQHLVMSYSDQSCTRLVSIHSSICVWKGMWNPDTIHWFSADVLGKHFYQQWLYFHVSVTAYLWLSISQLVFDAERQRRERIETGNISIFLPNRTETIQGAFQPYKWPSVSLLLFSVIWDWLWSGSYLNSYKLKQQSKWTL